MGRSPCCDGIGLKRGPWTSEEDQKLSAYIQQNGHGSWRTLPQKAGLQRCGKSCRLRWINYLKPDIKRGKFTLYEEQTIIQLHALLGNRWSIIAAHLPNRTDNEIKNYWNTRLKKRLTKMGIDPVTHKRKHITLCTSNDKSSSINMSVIDHIAQWESTRLEAEARLAKESKQLRFQNPEYALGSLNHDRLEPSNTTSLGGVCRPSFDILKAWQSGYGNANMAPPYTLSFLETTVAMLSARPSNSSLRTDSKSASVAATVDAKNYDHNNMDLHANGEGVVVARVADVAEGVNDCVLQYNSTGEWNIEQENYWNDIFSNPETLYSVVF